MGRSSNRAILSPAVPRQTATLSARTAMGRPDSPHRKRNAAIPQPMTPALDPPYAPDNFFRIGSGMGIATKPLGVIVQHTLVIFPSAIRRSPTLNSTS